MNDDEVIDFATELIKILEELSIAGYYASQLPNQYDQKIMQILAVLMAANANQREAFLSLLEEDTCVELSVFADCMSMLSVRENSPDHLVKGLVALSYAVTKKDYHETLMTLSLFCHSGDKLNIAPNDLFSTASQYAPNEAGRKLLLDFGNRSPEHQQISKMGFKEVSGPGGLTYQFGNGPIPDGWK